MAYCTADDVKAIKAVKRLLSPDGNWSDADITQRISETDAYIDSRLSTTYKVPISIEGQTPALIKRISILRTVFEMLTEEYGRNNDEYLYYYNESEKLLQRILDGEIHCNDDDTDQASIPTPRLIIQNNKRYFRIRED